MCMLFYSHEAMVHLYILPGVFGRTTLYALGPDLEVHSKQWRDLLSPQSAE